MLLAAIDPGNVYSAYVIMQSADCKPLHFGKVENAALEEMLKTDKRFSADEYVIERVACYGMAVRARKCSTPANGLDASARSSRTCAELTRSTSFGLKKRSLSVTI